MENKSLATTPYVYTDPFHCEIVAQIEQMEGAMKKRSKLVLREYIELWIVNIEAGEIRFKPTQDEMLHILEDKYGAIIFEDEKPRKEETLEKSSARAFRSAITELRKDCNIPLCTSRDGKGAYIPIVRDDAVSYVIKANRIAVNTARSHMDTVARLMKRWAPHLRPQILDISLPLPEDLGESFKVSILVDGNFSTVLDVVARTEKEATQRAVVQVMDEWEPDRPNGACTVEVTHVAKAP